MSNVDSVNVGGINYDVSSTKADKGDLTSISITGDTNTTGSTISSGTFFYKDGALVQAKADIANGAALTLNTNYEIVTAGGLNALNNALTYNFTTETRKYQHEGGSTTPSYTIPNDGLYHLMVGNGTTTSLQHSLKVNNISIGYTMPANYSRLDFVLPLKTGVIISGDAVASLYVWELT